MAISMTPICMPNWFERLSKILKSDPERLQREFVGIGDDGAIQFLPRQAYGPGSDEQGLINLSLEPRRSTTGQPPAGIRNHDCTIDGHGDSDYLGRCSWCGVSFED